MLININYSHDSQIIGRPITTQNKLKINVLEGSNDKHGRNKWSNIDAD